MTTITPESAVTDPSGLVSPSTLARKIRKVAGIRRRVMIADPDQKARQDILGMMDRVCDAGIVTSLRFAGDLCAHIADEDVVVAIAMLRHGAAIAGTPVPGLGAVPEAIQRLVCHIAGSDLPACIDISCRILGRHPDPWAGLAGVVVIRAALRAKLSIADATIAAVRCSQPASIAPLLVRTA